MRAQLRTLIVIITIAVALGFVPTDAQAQDVSRIAGTWVLNSPASTCSAGGTCLREMVRTYEDRGDGRVRATMEGVSGGRRIYQRYTARHDGRQYRLATNQTRGFTTIEFTRVDAYSSIWVIRRDGEHFLNGRSTVSMDGQTYTEASRNGVQVFDRRPQ